MRKFNSPVNLKAAADSFVSEAFIDVTLTELVSAHSIARPLLALHFRLKKWCDLVNGFGAECAWSISSERLQSAAQALIDYGYACSSVNRDIGAIGQVYRWAIVNRRMAPKGFISPTISMRRYEEKVRYVSSNEQDFISLRLAAKMCKDRLFTLFVWMLADSGARKSELLERTWNDLDISNAKMIVPMTKNGDSRTLFFSPATMSLAKQMRPSFSQATNLSNSKLHIHRLIFAGKNGITPINYRKKWTSLTSMLCRPELRMHDVRHWVAASLLRSGVGVGVASQIMGHRDQTMLLRRYGHLDACSLQSAQEVRWKISDTLMSPI
jgi:integrase